MRRLTRRLPSIRTTKQSLVVASASNSLLENTLRRCIRTFSGVVSNTAAMSRWDSQTVSCSNRTSTRTSPPGVS